MFRNFVRFNPTLRHGGLLRLTAYGKQHRTYLSVNNLYKKSEVKDSSQEQKKSSHFEERDLIYEVLSTVPSQREARHFLRRFVNSKESEVTPRSLQYVDTLLTQEKQRFFGLIKIQGPFDETLFHTIAPTLVQLKRLGLMPIVLLDHNLVESEWIQEQEVEKSELWKELASKEALKLVDAIEHVGGRARILDDQVFFVNNTNESSTQVMPSSNIMLNPKDKENQLNVNLNGILKCLEMEQIPVVIPMGTTHTSISKLLKSDSAMIGISRALGQSQDVETAAQTSVKLMIINKEGGIPSPHGTIGFINLQDEYTEILNDLQTEPTSTVSKRYVATLNMVKESLENLPVDSSAIMVPAKSSKLLISNWIRDKPLYSISLPKWQNSQVTSSVIRRGFEVRIFRGLEGLDVEKLNNLLELAFAKSLDKENFWNRVKSCLSSVIVAGDYQGAAIVTKEHQMHPYLDKFAVDPKKQGGGVADILWKKLTSTYPELTWRSRKDNGVNKWYFERSDGNVRIPDTNWVLFWYGRKGIENLDEYYEIAKHIPPSFNTVKH
ncbi:Amino-acid acetyltransferase, mitochondrial [Basidiobolus ranarum]|uniref:Amino-acid acetyltransferase, mitochondrial n=1 Tax=Basidiobolus ranarum TaxID=34480 RepID=A0ABR2W4R5_9FUNG